MKAKSIYPLIFAYIILFPVMFLLPILSVDEYSIIRNTTSHLGAQHAPYAWVMNIEFILLGITSIYAGFTLLKEYPFQKFVILIFGLSLVLTAFSQHAPIIDIPYSQLEDTWHSRFATITGFAFVFLAISAAFTSKYRWQSILSITAGLFATVLSILMFNIPDFMGLFQRGIFTISFGWLIFFLVSRDRQVKAS